MQFIYTLDDIDRDEELGGKGRALAFLQRQGLPVPAWCAVSPSALTASLLPGRSATDMTEEERLALQPAAAVRAALQLALTDLCPDGALVAVRSSASDEDGAAFSFAGQLESYLGVTPERVPDQVAAVWRSGCNPRLLAYRREHGLSALPPPPAVLIQRMVKPEVAGVAFSADPVSGRRGVAVVSAVYGLASALVSGESDADTYQIDRQGVIIARQLARKQCAHRADPAAPEGIRRDELPAAMQTAPALSDAQVLAVAALARQAERCCGRPQDIEWAIEDGQLYLLQSRPITSLAQVPDPDGAVNLWDNSNIAESYNGVTTPLTFSFARKAYEHVYRHFCRLMGVSEATIAEQDDTFRRMLGLIRGRIYYNLLNWYRVLALLPGFTVNRRFMEQMMGVKEGLPDELVAVIQAATWQRRLRASYALFTTVFRLVGNYLTITTSIRRFYARLATALAPPSPPLEAMRADELAVYYRALERQLLTRWDAPLVNDFFAMIFYGVLGQCASRWCHDADGTLRNALLSGQGGIISAEPARRLCELATLAAARPGFTEMLRSAPLDVIRRAFAGYPAFADRYQAYLDAFGDRCLEELKLESATLHDDPLMLLRSVGQLAGGGECLSSPPADDQTTLAKARVARALAWQPLQRLLFAWVLDQARARVRDRENLRFERTRLFGRVRRIFLEIGRRFTADGLLDTPRDIFFLEVPEITGVIEGTASSADLRALVAARQAEFARYRAEAAPDDRFSTTGTVHQGNTFRQAVTATAPQDGDVRKGLACCPGVVRGRVRVIIDPRDAILERGVILVAERTDPGWIMLFPGAAGVLVERGSLLSHSAIVARELRIPAIVSIPGLTRWLADGDWVEFDGSSGVVRRLPMSVEARDGE